MVLASEARAHRDREDHPISRKWEEGAPQFSLTSGEQACDPLFGVTEQIISDSVLIRRIVEGDGSAVGLLYDRYAQMLFPIAIRILRDRAEAEDTLHDAFVGLVDRATQFSETRGSVAAWLVTIVRNLSIDRMRRRDRRGAIARNQLAAEVQEPAAAEEPEMMTAVAQERHKIQRALSTLPPPQRQTLERAFFEGLSYPEIAELEGVPLGTIKSRAARALAALREALAREGILRG
jgi:RNA polymerase sigma-70 factor (ECF subfamily)